MCMEQKDSGNWVLSHNKRREIIQTFSSEEAHSLISLLNSRIDKADKEDKTK